MEVYNTNTGQWTQDVPDMNQKRAEFSCATLNGEIYALGGTGTYVDGDWELDLGRISWEKFSFGAKQWTSLGLIEGHKSGFALAIFESKIFNFFATVTEGRRGDVTVKAQVHHKSAHHRWTQCQDYDSWVEGTPRYEWGKTWTTWTSGVVVKRGDLGPQFLATFQPPLEGQESQDEEHVEEHEEATFQPPLDGLELQDEEHVEEHEKYKCSVQ